MKTPKEKAIQLVDKFISQGCSFAAAIEYAKIAVDEVIQSTWLKETYTTHMGLIAVEETTTKEYWQEVKNELKNNT